MRQPAAKRFSFQTKLITITILLILGPVILVSMLFYTRYTRDLQRQSEDSAVQMATQISYNLETYIEELYRVAEMPYYSDSVMNALAKPPKTDLEKLEKRRVIETYLDEIMITPRKDIISVYIIADEIYHGGKFSVPISYEPDPTSYGWYIQAIDSNKPVFLPAHNEVLTTQPRFEVFGVAMRINKISNPSVSLGVIKVDANYAGIKNVLDHADFGSEGGLFILDNNQTVVYQSRTDMDVLFLYTQKQEDSTVSKQRIDLNGQTYLLTYTSIVPAEWTIITVHSVREMQQNAIATRNFTYLVAAGSTLAALLLLLLIMRQFLRPLNEVVSLMKRVRGGDLKAHFPETHHDEIEELGSAFNAMLDRVNVMLKEVDEARQLQNEVQLNALYSQIHPHFLFNTLNMISLLIRCGRADEAVESVNDLSDLLRAMVNIDTDIELTEEAALLQNYLAIQARRYEGRLLYRIDIPERFAHYRLPALILQPIVENAVVHGCENNKGVTSITVQVKENAPDLIIMVEDNAGGIPNDQLLRLQDRLKSGMAKDGEQGIGLYNADKRIKLRFGKQYGLTITSREGNGTSVSIMIPVQTP